MNDTDAQGFTVLATANEVMPKFGLAFVTDDQDTVWGLTKSTAGPGLATLQTGARIRLNLRLEAGFSLVESYQRVD